MYNQNYGSDNIGCYRLSTTHNSTQKSYLTCHILWTCLNYKKNNKKDDWDGHLDLTLLKLDPIWGYFCISDHNLWWLLRLQSWKVATIHWNQVWLMLVFAIDFGNCQLQQLGDWSLYWYLDDPLKIPDLIFYPGTAHAFEYLSNQWSCLEVLHPALAHCMLLEISSLKGWL